MLRVAATFAFVAPLVAILIVLIVRQSVPDVAARFTAMGMALSLTCLVGFSLSVLVLSNRALIQGTPNLRRAALGAAANGALLVILGLSAF
jgi:hypothetical protein